MPERLVQMSRIRGQTDISPIKRIDRGSRNKWPERRNLLALSTDYDTRDGHYLRENTRDPSFYGGVEQFTATPWQRRGLQFQRQLGQRAEHTQYIGSKWRHDHGACWSIYLDDASDNLKGNQVAGRRFRSHYRQHEIVRYHRDGDENVCHDPRRPPNQGGASRSYW